MDTVIPPQPEQPTILLFLTYDQATAIRDAVTAFGMAVDGEAEMLAATYAKKDGPDMGAANAWADDQVRLAYEVHNMIDVQQIPYVKRFRRWWDSVSHRFEPRPR